MSSEVKALEHSTLVVPYELLNKKFRAAQKIVERELNRVGCTVTDLEQVLATPTVHAHQVNGVVGSLLDKLHSLKRKASETVEEERLAACVLKRRLGHLKVATDLDTSTNELERWKHQRIDRFVVDYLLRTGYIDTAEKIAQYDHIDFLSNADIFIKAKDVEKSLANGDTSKWSDWAMDNKSKLRRIKSGLELKIRRQEFVELIKKGEKMEAVKFARKYFSELDADLWPSLASTMGLLGLPTFNGRPVTNIQRYNDMFSEDRWNLLVDEFRAENLRLFCLNQPIFSELLQCGLSAMKTPKCAKACKDASNVLASNGTILNPGSNTNETATVAPPRERRSGSTSSVVGSRSTSPRGRRNSLIRNQSTDCADQQHFTTNRGAQCPLCVGPALRLGAQLPLAHASQSRLICAISGEPVNDANPPLALPNGMVYGTRALQEMAAADARGRITCPRTGQQFELADSERVFVM